VTDLAVILVVCELGFLVIHKFPVLLSTEAAVIAPGCLLRFKTSRRRGERSSPLA
jgi:hypothetical protein